MKGVEKIAEMDYNIENLARRIVNIVLQYRRFHSSESMCALPCASCESPHLQRIMDAIRNSKPINFVIPGFPGKSSNLCKVLSPLPDMAEIIALEFLQNLCKQIYEVYSYGAIIVICSDGRVFSDIVGMSEANITAYQQGVRHIIQERNLNYLSTFNLDQVYNDEKDRNFDEIRKELLMRFGAPAEVLRNKVLRASTKSGNREDEEAYRIYLGITQFLVDDSTYPGQTKTQTEIQQDCQLRAYDIIRRSNAWTKLVGLHFPEAVRLSIHPQSCGSSKIGIRLVGDETWMTPWHGVAVKTKNGFVLMKRTEAEDAGAQLIYTEDARPSYFLLN